MDELDEMELTLEQTRAVAAIRARVPGAELRFHPRDWGFILEVRAPGAHGEMRTRGLARFERGGAIRPDAHLRRG